MSPSVNRKHKDTVFRRLFQDKKNLLSLYNALNGTDYDEPEDVRIVTLDNAIYMSMKNDNAFILHDFLNLYEHQSSFNPNMPLRDLFYIARELESLVQGTTLYTTQQVKIPTPRFVVFYNGTESQPECRILRLSDAFRMQEPEPWLELKVLMLNINPGYNRELMEQCRTLREYMLFVESIRKNAKTMDMADAVDSAVKDCIDKGILKEFLIQNRTEVATMSIFEYNEEEEKRKIGEIYYKQGLEKGLEKSREEREKMLHAMIEYTQQLGILRESAFHKIMTQFGLTEEKTEEYFLSYWQ